MAVNKVSIISLVLLALIQSSFSKKLVSPSKNYNDILCFIACPKIIDPVCGENGDSVKFFHNYCMLLKNSCETKKEWIVTDLERCEKNNSELRSSCEKPCPYIYLPICGYNGEKWEVFPNQCDMEVQNCGAEKEWKMVKLSDCGSVIPL